ncbi:hypothetical protein B2G69_07840 [Methylorubrum zatmanii]|nr:hypothetical protein B2G69_07840 [Methylorubrum zatmanii]
MGHEGRLWTTRYVHAWGKAVDRDALSAHLAGWAQSYVAQGGMSEISDAMVADVHRRVVKWCADDFKVPTRKGFSASNTALFEHLRHLSYAWAKKDLTRSKGRVAVDQDALRAYLHEEMTAYRAVPGQAHDDDGCQTVVWRIAVHSGRMSRAVKRMLRREERLANFAATAEARADLRFAVEAEIEQERLQAEREAREPVELTIDALHERLRFETVTAPGGTTVRRETGVTRAAVRGAVETVRGQPKRERLVQALRMTARDLFAVLEEACPEKRVVVLDTDALAGRLWAPATNAAGRRQHRHRLKAAASDINAARVGMSVDVLGREIVVGWGVRLPSDTAAAVDAARAAGAIRRLQGGLLERRKGVWGTSEGVLAIALCRASCEQYGEVDVVSILRAAGLPDAGIDVKKLSYDEHDEMDARFLENVGVVADDLRDMARKGQATDRGQAMDGADVLVRLHGIANDEGLCQAWFDLTGMAAYRATIAGATASGARHRVRQLGVILGTVDRPEDWQRAVAASLVRPGRRHNPVPVAPPRPLAVQRPAQEKPPVSAPERIRPMPARVPDAALSGEVQDDIESSRRASAWKQGIEALALTWAPYEDASENSDSVVRLLPKTVDEAKARLRTCLRLLKTDAGLAGVRAYDEETGGAVRQALTDAGLALKAEGGVAFVHAGMLVHSVTSAHDLAAARALPRTLRHLADDRAWARTEAAAAAA